MPVSCAEVSAVGELLLQITKTIFLRNMTSKLISEKSSSVNI